MNLHHAGKEYPVDKVLFFTAICPTAQVKTEDLVFNENSIVTQSKHIVVYPYDNKYLVLVDPGNIDMAAAMQSVKIMGKIVLKKIAHANDAVEDEEPSAHRQRVNNPYPKNRQPNRRGEFKEKDGYHGY